MSHYDTIMSYYEELYEEEELARKARINKRVDDVKKDCDGSFEDIGWKVGELVNRKQKAYGDSFGKAGDCLRQMYPDGIKLEQFDDLLTIVRILDKLFRIASNPNAFDENPFQDIVGYGLLGMKRYSGKPK